MKPQGANCQICGKPTLKNPRSTVIIGNMFFHRYCWARRTYKLIITYATTADEKA